MLTQLSFIENVKVIHVFSIYFFSSHCTDVDLTDLSYRKHFPVNANARKQNFSSPKWHFTLTLFQLYMSTCHFFHCKYPYDLCLSQRCIIVLGSYTFKEATVAIGYFIFTFQLCKSTSLIAIHIGNIRWHHPEHLRPFMKGSRCSGWS